LVSGRAWGRRRAVRLNRSSSVARPSAAAISRLSRGSSMIMAGPSFWLSPPGFGKEAHQRRLPRVLDRRPTRNPMVREMEQRNHVEAGDQHAIERAHGGDHLGAGLGLEQCADQSVDGGTLDADVIATASLIRGGRAPIEGLLVARRERLVPTVRYHVEIEGDAARFE